MLYGIILILRYNNTFYHDIVEYYHYNLKLPFVWLYSSIITLCHYQCYFLFYPLLFQQYWMSINSTSITFCHNKNMSLQYNHYHYPCYYNSITICYYSTCITTCCYCIILVITEHNLESCLRAGFHPWLLRSQGR